uniref:Uncharacterized protein n=1 Tax=Proboscia inermis TaxID=420281 RepID=A0A6T8F9J6_9STRA|mmetsp:Transcript_11037/g.11143  ORF Transcript_11037/g.11143 Transcript_11037/m.11143 type:complete len:187 (+) Transcript_11037:222-782(+)|eukprot:CAMPEP_0171314232 /NCGR_PEP_ID=MMETSP0816-20121228/50111_1 /TAXON_ID=420281 /ORGANISM="Proboscia inermis, Strain CCAP1064/1" /LENGTH=186 /DNA_ID=CAMNT_0011802891 /DNA_START=212 /DNA_END=772 /DNA_ORIENTATION=+
MDPLVMELLEAERNSQYFQKGDAGDIFNGTVMGDLLFTDRLFDGHSSLTQAAKSMSLIVDLFKMDRLMDGTSNSPPVHTEVKKQEPRRNIFSKHEMTSTAERSSILSTEKVFADILAVDTMIANEQKNKTHSQYMNLMQDLLAVDEMIDNAEQQNLENSLKLANPGGNSQEGCVAVEPRRSIFSPK